MQKLKQWNLLWKTKCDVYFLCIFPSFYDLLSKSKNKESSQNEGRQLKKEKKLSAWSARVNPEKKTTYGKKTLNLKVAYFSLIKLAKVSTTKDNTLWIDFKLLKFRWNTV